MHIIVYVTIIQVFCLLDDRYLYRVSSIGLQYDRNLVGEQLVSVEEILDADACSFFLAISDYRIRRKLITYTYEVIISIDSDV